MQDLQALFAESILSAITAVKDAKGMTDIALIEALADRGAFSDDNSPQSVERIKKAKRNLYYDWRVGKSKSFLKLLEPIAEILETEVSLLAPPVLSREERILLEKYRALPQEKQRELLSAFPES